MKKALALAAAAALFVGSAVAQGKSLVVYFSHTGEQYGVGNVTEGNTAVIAKMIAGKSGAEIFEIVPEKDYPKVYKECTDVAKKEQNERARPAYKGDIDTAQYDTVFIGYPIWWGDLPMVVYTFLEKHDLSGKTLVPFCTHEGSGVSGTDSKIKGVCKGATVKGALAVRGLGGAEQAQRGAVRRGQVVRGAGAVAERDKPTIRGAGGKPHGMMIFLPLSRSCGFGQSARSEAK